MLLTELEGRLSFYLKDTARTRFKTPTLIAALSDAQQQFARDTFIYRKQATAVVTSGIADISGVSPSPIGPVLRVEDPANSNQVIYPVSASELDALYGAGWRANVTAPIQFWIQGLPGATTDGFDTLTVFPLVATQNLTVYYPALPPAFIIGQTPTAQNMIPPAFHMAIVWGAVMNLLGEPDTPADQQSAKYGTTQYAGYVKTAQDAVKQWMEGR